MPRRTSFPIASATILLLALLACSGKKPQEPDPGGATVLRLEPLPDEHAELIALWLSQEIEAPLPLYERVSSELADIDRIAPFMQGVGTFPPVISPLPSEISVDFHPGGIEAVQSGESPVWDSLNQLYQPTVVWGPDPDRARLQFPGRLNSRALAEAYGQVPEVKGVGQHGSGYEVGKWRRAVYSGLGLGDSILYVFFGGMGPDNEMITQDTLFCFISTSVQVEHVGTFIPHVEDVPSWWTTFCAPLSHTTAGRWCFGSYKNLLVNGSFEEAGEPTLVGWQPALPQLASIIQTITRAGAYALMLESDWTPMSSYVTTRVGGLSSGDIVRLGAYMRSPVPSDGCSISLMTGESLAAPLNTTTVGTSSTFWRYVSIVDTLTLRDGDSVWVKLSAPNADVQQKWGLFDLIGLAKLGHTN